jgi:hypothetical protein
MISRSDRAAAGIFRHFQFQSAGVMATAGAGQSEDDETKSSNSRGVQDNHYE